MNAECFLDTNILVYAVASDKKEKDKRNRSIELIESKDFGLSAQVLQEFFVTVTRKIQVPLSTLQAMAWIEQFEVFPCIDIDKLLVKIAIEISERYQVSYWDGAIIAAASQLQSEILYSEDLNHGQTYSTVRVVNPYKVDTCESNLVSE